MQGGGVGIANGMFCFAEVELFFVGAALMTEGLFGDLRIVEVLNLVLLSVTMGRS